MKELSHEIHPPAPSPFSLLSSAISHFQFFLSRPLPALSGSEVSSSESFLKNECCQNLFHSFFYIYNLLSKQKAFVPLSFLRNESHGGSGKSELVYRGKWKLERVLTCTFGYFVYCLVLLPSPSGEGSGMRGWR